MGRYGDNAPVKNTCPTIDNIISKMEYASAEAEYILKNPEEDSTHEARNIISELSVAILDMENIRSDNQELRQWGNDECNRAEELEDERDYALKRCEELEDEINDLKQQIEELSEQ